MKKFNQVEFHHQIREYSDQDLAKCIGHVFLAFLHRHHDKDDLLFLKKWCNITATAAYKFVIKHIEKD
jgi:hypothetical protein